MATSSRHINTHAPTTLHRVEPPNLSQIPEAGHHALWGQPTGPTFVGHMPTFNNDDEYRHTFYAANQAIHDLSQSVGIPGRSAASETPGLSL